MAFIPFIYFTFLTIYWWKKHNGFDICVYMSALYAITSLLAVITIISNTLGVSGILFKEHDVYLGFVPTVLYCTFLTITLLPFSIIYTKRIKGITSTMTWIADALALLFIVVGIINFWAVFDSTAEILSGDLETVRQAAYLEDMSPAQIKMEKLPIYLKIFTKLHYATILCIPLFFYYICCKHRPWWFIVLLLLASLSAPIQAIQTADRNEFVHYAMMFFFCIIFFYRLMSKKVRRGIYWLSGIFAVIFSIYIVAVSMARFGKSSEGTSGSIIAYAGQGYINFCYFWENANFGLIAPEREFPMTMHVLANVDSDSDRRMKRSAQHGFFISVFPTFLGEIMLDLSPIGMAIWSCYYFLLTMLVIRSSKREEFDIGEVIAIFALAVIPTFGIFYYRYFYFLHAFITIIAGAMYLCSKFKIVYR